MNCRGSATCTAVRYSGNVVPIPRPTTIRSATTCHSGVPGVTCDSSHIPKIITATPSVPRKR